MPRPDDEAGCREGMRRLLEAWGYEAQTAESAEDALELLSNGGPNAIITDLVESRYSKMEIAAFLVASGEGGLDRDEVLYLTRAMLGAGAPERGRLVVRVDQDRVNR